FPGPGTAACAEQIVNQNPTPLDSEKLPAELVRIISKLIEKAPQARYQSTRDLLIDLNNLVRSLEIGAAYQGAQENRKAVAVLPFRLLTPNAQDEYLIAALADAIIGRLSSETEVLVRPASAVMRYAKQLIDPIQTGRELNVDVVVDGSIQKFGDR